MKAPKRNFHKKILIDRKNPVARRVVRYDCVLKENSPGVTLVSSGIAVVFSIQRGMILIIEPRRFIGLPLLTRAVAESEFKVTVDGLQAGRIMLREATGKASRWFWSLSGPAAMTAGINASGDAASFEEARDALRAAFDEWISWALHQRGGVHWHGGSDA